jgi:transcriptional regulator with XRE-family HTH domain
MAQYQNRALRKRIGIRVRDLRKRAGVKSQESLGELAGLHRTYVGRLERGERGVTVESLAAVLEPLQVSLSEFFEPFVETLRVRAPRRRN